MLHKGLQQFVVYLQLTVLYKACVTDVAAHLGIHVVLQTGVMSSIDHSHRQTCVRCTSTCCCALQHHVWYALSKFAASNCVQHRVASLAFW